MRQKHIFSTVLLVPLIFNFQNVKSLRNYKHSFRTENPFDSLQGKQWGTDEFCPEDEFVVGFKIRYMPFQGSSSTTNKVIQGIMSTIDRITKSNDNLGLTGIELYCAKPNSKEYRNITSKFPPSVTGEKITSELVCPNHEYANGFQLKTLEKQKSKDDVGASNFQLVCEDGTILKNSLEYEPGEWPKEFQTCPENTHICGLRTSVQTETDNHGDNTGLNAVEIYCCQVKLVTAVDIAKTCTPQMEWRLIKEYDNTYGLTSQTNTYEEKIGMTNLNSNLDSEKKVTTSSAENGYNVGPSVTVGDKNIVQAALSANFHQAFKSATSKEQESEKLLSQSIYHEVKHTVSFETPPGVISRFFQLVGSCDIFEIHSIQFRREDKLVKGNGQAVKSETENIVRNQ